MKETTITFLLLLSFYLQPAVSQVLNSPADSVAKGAGIIIEKELDDLIIYDYGQTTMIMRFMQLTIPNGTYYYSRLELEAPGEFSTTVLTISKTRKFLNKLYSFLEIDKEKDVLNPIPKNGVDAGVRVWGEDKDYGFYIPTTNGGIKFILRAKKENLDESLAVGEVDPGWADFKINDFKEYRSRVRAATKNMLKIVEQIKSDEDAINYKDEGGARGYKIDYGELSKNGIVVVKTGVHQTNSIQILADIKIKRTPRIIPINEFDANEIGEYELVFDDQAQIYAKEKIDIRSLMNEISELVKSYSGNGILDPKILPSEDNGFFVELSIVKIPELEQNQTLFQNLLNKQKPR